ncbi:hypothetical protein SO802_028377 [Lithocarpus litseifolius]|uniref:Bifunctional inhibitor/plant lipid transfer protein/seed storage helical domain-containing protein n=1 Tax=Lithocarpus litseifolius TaxID=425828 RepID=A0AAW2BRK5_9ROSI
MREDPHRQDPLAPAFTVRERRPTPARPTLDLLQPSQGLCHMTKEGLKACQPSVSGQNPVPPSASCCSALSNADFQCLCIFKNSNLLNFYGINSTLAMELPAKCNQAQPHC